MNDKNDLLFKFKEHLKAGNNSLSTITSYYDHIKHFLNTVEKYDILEVTRPVIENYIAGLYRHRTREGTPYKTATICIKVRSIKRFFEFLERANIIFIDPSESIKEPVLDKTLPKKILTRHEVRKVFDQPNLSTRIGIRDRAILEVFDTTGIRLNEICCLIIYDADLKAEVLRINKGKGRKDRVVPLGRHAVKFLKEYIAKVRPHLTKKNRSERRLFVDRTGRGIKKQAVHVMVKKYGQMALGKSITPHLFRHGFATGLIRNGAHLLAVQKMMGHEDPRTTQLYVRSLGLDIRKVHKKTHPREKDRVRNIKPDIKGRV